MPELSDDEKQLVQTSRLMQDLKGLVAWQELERIGQAQIAVRREMLLLPEHQQNREDGPSEEFLKGAIYGIDLILQTPSYIIRDAQGILEEHGAQGSGAQEVESDD
jgi:hypothetical protein